MEDKKGYPESSLLELREVDRKNKAMAHALARSVADHGGTAYYVGGYVRDLLRYEWGMDCDIPVSDDHGIDLDIEVHGIEREVLEDILDRLGEKTTVGETFGIYGLEDYDLDIALPRTEVLTGQGHKDFSVTVDPYAGTYKAALRRDFTINAMMQNILTGEFVDEYGGMEDLKQGIIRQVNGDTYTEDPLRLLRAAQFAARFDYKVAPETIELCKKMSLEHLPKERVFGELKKALLKARKPSVFFEELRRMNQLSIWFPELEDLIGVKQNPKYHAEGDVWIHTMMVLDCAAGYREQVHQPLAFMLSALSHDLGKAVCSNIVNGEIHSYKHEMAGIPLAEHMIGRLTSEREMIRYILDMVKNHMRPNMLVFQNSSIKATNRMFDESIDPEDLIYLSKSDKGGQIWGEENGDPIVEVRETYLDDRYEIYKEYMARPYVAGKDLIQAGVKPSKNFSEYLAYAHKLRLAGIDKEEALKQTLTYIDKKNKR